MILLVRKKRKKRTKAWVDNLTLSYIADSNIDLTKVIRSQLQDTVSDDKFLYVH